MSVDGIELKFCPLCGNSALLEHENYTNIIAVDRKYECVRCYILFYSHRWDNRILWYPTASDARPWFDPMCRDKKITPEDRDTVGK
jgi:ribosomal protein S27AE